MNSVANRIGVMCVVEDTVVKTVEGLVGSPDKI